MLYIGSSPPPPPRASKALDTPDGATHEQLFVVAQTHKVVVLEDLASEFGLPTQEVIKRVSHHGPLVRSSYSSRIRLFTMSGDGNQARPYRLLSRVVTVFGSPSLPHRSYSNKAFGQVENLEQMRRITGVVDDRGKFIFIEPEELEKVGAILYLEKWHDRGLRRGPFLLPT
jgi:hypothetical protein